MAAKTDAISRAVTSAVSTPGMPSPAFHAVFFRDAPVELRAVANSGYRFDGWTGASSATTDTTSIVLAGNSAITAHFSIAGTGTGAGSDVPRDTRLLQNYPNPFSSTTRIDFDTATAGLVRFEVYDVLGRRVATVADGFRPAGRHSVVFDGAGHHSGVFFLRLSTQDVQAVRQISLVR